MATELKPCPFCGKSGDRNVQLQYGSGVYAVRCLSCGARGPSEFEEEAGERWNCSREPALFNAVRRIVELESLLLIPVEKTVWPAEVELIFSQVEQVLSLPEPHQERIRHHINRMWLESVPMQKITSVASSLVKTLEQYA
jgi:Lar family restriction alleviation protein